MPGTKGHGIDFFSSLGFGAVAKGLLMYNNSSHDGFWFWLYSYEERKKSSGHGKRGIQRFSILLAGDPGMEYRIIRLEAFPPMVDFGDAYYLLCRHLSELSS